MTHEGFGTIVHIMFLSVDIVAVEMTLTIKSKSLAAKNLNRKIVQNKEKKQTRITHLKTLTL